MAKFTRILSIDGGGIRGIIPGQVPVSLEQKLKKQTASTIAYTSKHNVMKRGAGDRGIKCGGWCPFSLR